MPIVHGFLVMLKSVMLEVIAVVALIFILTVWLKTKALTPVLVAIALSGLVLFAANNLPFIQSTTCDTVRAAATAGGGAAPGC